MGRAFPELQMTTFGMHGVSATPMVLGDDKGNSVVLETINNRWTERLARSATVDMGGSALLAFYPMSGAVAKKAIVRGTLTPLRRPRAQAARGARAPRRSDRGGAGGARAEIIFNGRVKDVLRRTVGGFARGEAEIEGLDEHRGHKLRIAFQNEFLIAERDGETIVTTPDMITLLDAETGAPITADAHALRHSRRRARLSLRPSNGAPREASNWSARATSATTSISGPLPRARRDRQAPPESASANPRSTFGSRAPSKCGRRGATRTMRTAFDLTERRILITGGASQG